VVTAATKRASLVFDNQPPLAAGVPHVARVGDLLFSSVFTGHLDPQTGQREKHPAKQMANAYANMRAHLAAAGATLADVAYVRNYIRYRGNRPFMNDEWKKLYGESYRVVMSVHKQD
jgi:enamine deaminase RidA (YjgF/YER057c/UK114 family)